MINDICGGPVSRAFSSFTLPVKTFSGYFAECLVCVMKVHSDEILNLLLWRRPGPEWLPLPHSVHTRGEEADPPFG